MYAIVNTKQIKDAIKQIKSLGGVAVKVEKEVETLVLTSYHMPNNCYNGEGCPQYYPCGELLRVEVTLKLSMPLENGPFEFITTLEALKSGTACASGGYLKITFENGKAWCDGAYQQSLPIIDAEETSMSFQHVEYDEVVNFSVPVGALRFVRPFADKDDLTRDTFNRICIEDGGIVACDGHALGCKDWWLPDDGKIGYQVPVKFDVVDAILSTNAETVEISAYIKVTKLEKDTLRKFAGATINADNYTFMYSAPKTEFRFPDFRKVFPERMDNCFVIDSDKWYATISNLIKGFNYPQLEVEDEPDNFVFKVHEIRPKKGKVALEPREARISREAFKDYAWCKIRCDAKLFCKALKAHDSNYTMIHVQDDIIVMESWAGKSIVMMMGV